MSPRAAGATQHELSRIGLLATLPGETLGKLAQNMTREEIPAGASVVSEGESGERFYVVLSGMLSVSQRSRGEQRRASARRLLRRSRTRDAHAAHRVGSRAHAGDRGEL